MHPHPTPTMVGQTLACVTLKFTFLGLGSLHFGCVNKDKIEVGLLLGLMKLKLHTAQQNSHKFKVRSKIYFTIHITLHEFI